MLAEVPTGIQQNPDSSIAAAPRTKDNDNITTCYPVGDWLGGRYLTWDANPSTNQV
jgi:hypothetical protein